MGSSQWPTVDFRKSKRGLCLLTLVLAFAAGRVPCRASGDVPLINIGGVLCARVLLRTEAAEVPAHVVIDLGTRGPMLVHYGTAGLLGFGSEGTVDVIHEQTGSSLLAVQSVAMALEPLEKLTREHARELEDIPAVAVIGMPAFSGKRVELDVGANLLRIETGTAVPEPSGGTAGRETIQLAAEAYGYWTTAQTSGGRGLRVRFSTSEYDTRIDALLAEALGSPGGDLPQLMLGGIDLMRHVVLRPSDMSGFPEPKPEIILGTQLLMAFRLLIDPDSLRVTFIPTGEPRVPLHEREFFVARARRDVTAVEAFVRNRPDSRLAAEAAETLLQLALEQDPTNPETVQHALSVRAQAAEPDHRAITMVQTADELIALDQQRPDAYDLAASALDLAREFCSQDLDDTALHHVNARLGLIALLRGDYSQARRWLLSAAFGLPRDPYVNFYLGFLYERTGQRSRAWSRYVESCLKSAPPVGAMRGLDRLSNNPAFRRSFSMLDAEQLLEGRLPEFVPARKWISEEPGEGHPVRLVELFTSTLIPETQAAEMAFDGLARYLDETDAVLLQYHLNDVLSSDATDARQAFYEVQDCPAAFFDGQGPLTEGGKDEAAARVFAAYRHNALAGSPRKPAEPPALGTAVLRNGNLTVDWTAPIGLAGGAYVQHVLLCERAVLCVGENGRLIHHHVVRAPLTPEAGIDLDTIRQSRFHVEVGLWSARQRLEQRIGAFGDRLGFKPAMKATWIDPQQCEVVEFVQDTESKAIVRASMIPVSLEEDGAW